MRPSLRFLHFLSSAFGVTKANRTEQNPSDVLDGEPLVVLATKPLPWCWMNGWTICYRPAVPDHDRRSENLTENEVTRCPPEGEGH